MVLPVKRGLSSPAVIGIPQEWDRQWFRYFIDSFLTNADVRNVQSGSGIVVSGNVSGNSTSGTPSNIVTISQAPIASGTVLGNVSGSTAVPTAITGTQLTTLINIFTATLSGAAPASGGGTVNFLRADGTWQTPAGSAAIPNNTVLGNVSGVVASAVALTQTQLTALINTFTAVLSGAVPLSGGGTTNFLRADGTWNVPPVSTGANPTASVGLSAVNGVATTFLRSDGAPALSQGIVPTWTGIHTFSARPAFNLGATVSGGTFISRGISDSATAIALTIASTGAISTSAPSAGSSLTVNGNAASVAESVISGFTGATSGATTSLLRANSTANSIGVGPALNLGDTTATTASMLQHSGGQTELWQTQNNGALWSQVFKVLTTNAITINTPVSGTCLIVNGVAAGVSTQFTDGTTDFRFSHSGGSSILGTSTNTPLAFATNGTTRLSFGNTGIATFTGVAAASTAWVLNAQNVAGSSNGMSIRAGTTSADIGFIVSNAGNTTDYFKIRGDGETFVGPNGTLLFTLAALTNNAGASPGTLTNAPAAGNPTKWIKINDNGTIRSIPAW